MKRYTRRAFVAAGVAVAAGTAGCSSGGEESSTPPELGDVASTSTPTTDGALPTPVAGDPDADVTVAVYEDYACPHCGTYSLEVFPQVASDYLEPGTVRYEFHDFPIPVDETVSWQAANAARAVQAAAGPQAYFEYSEALFANQSSLGPDTYASLADDVGVDGAAVRQAATDRTYDETVTADRQAGQDRGVSGTPTVFVDDSEVEWSEIAYEPVRDAIEAARDQ
ncbi:DsbA family protein [Haloarcula onubensis]|uniref:DsbA family protein n=1 Tax=Haloarcula onubensis TaxID=2950539 RepID=A0ABU2FV13_9EURY|nr:thioredoxin domain-containing protein [Halomicroarcula sp. S3CR25-11]MDS0284132.1 DsbA family protein [Halomicroarcula sp. S3CR25-11]